LTARIVAEHGLTTMMVTHSMRQALDVGDRTVMLHQGRVVLDVSGDTRRGLEVPDLLAMFEKVRGEELADDTLLLGCGWTQKGPEDPFVPAESERLASREVDSPSRSMRRGGCHGWRLFRACRIRAACKPRGGQSESQHATRGLPRLETVPCLPNPSGLQARRGTQQEDVR